MGTPVFRQPGALKVVRIKTGKFFKGTTSVIRSGHLYRETKKRFRDWVVVKDICGCGS